MEEEGNIPKDPEEILPGSRPMSGSGAENSGSRPVSGLNNSTSRPSSGVNTSRPVSSKEPQTNSRPPSGAWNNTAKSPSKSSVTGDTETLITEEEPPKGCWDSFTRGIGGMWASREMTSKEDREIFVRTTIRELIVYLIFLVVFCFLTFGMASTQMYFYTQVMGSLFKDYEEVEQVTDFWDFMEGSMLDGIYWEYLYNDGTDKRFICPGGEEAVGPCPVAPADRNILYENRLLGLPRLRQIRVKNDSCLVHPDFQNAIKQCYGPYSESNEDMEPFGTGFRHKTSPQAWSYNDASVTHGNVFSGLISTYGAAGAIQDFHSLKNETAAILKELKEGLWISRATRFVTLDFTVYNANINLFCIVKLAFEFPATGGVIPKTEYRTVKLLRYVTAWDYFIMSCEAIFIAFIIYYTVEEVLEIKKHRISYFASVWNNLDLVVICNAAICIALSIASIITINGKLEDLLDTPDVFADFTSLGDTMKNINNAIAVNVFFAWIKLFKYISFNKTMTQLSSTLARCAGDVMGFGVMFFIVFFAFAQLGYLLFGTQVKDFSTFSDGIFTLLRTILGDFDFHAIESANRILGPVYFLSYVFFVFFVLLNMFLAIINDTYSEVKAEIAAQKNEFEIGDYFKRGYNNMLGHIGGRNKYIDIENALKLAGSDGVVTYEEIRQNLKKCNFSDMEIEMFFARYDKDGNFVFTPEETNEILNDISYDRVDRPDAAPENSRSNSGKEARSARSARIMADGERRKSMAQGGISGEEFQVLEKRVERMEKSVGSICTKIDAVLAKLETMEKGKNKRKKLFDTMTSNEEVDDQTKRQEMEAKIRKELEHWDSSRPSTSDSVNN